MILQLLRHCMTAGVVAQGVLAGLADPQPGESTERHARRSGDAWTLDSLARVSGMSRARGALPPCRRDPAGDYLADWRISVPKTLLKRGQPLKNVALDVGYASASAFARLRGTACGHLAHGLVVRIGRIALALSADAGPDAGPGAGGSLDAGRLAGAMPREACSITVHGRPSSRREPAARIHSARRTRAVR